jgi:hypothetical protein
MQTLLDAAAEAGHTLAVHVLFAERKASNDSS